MEKEFRTRIIAAIKADRLNHSSSAKQAITLGINGAQLSRIINEDTENVLADAKWYSIARRLDVQLKESEQWVTARTEAYEFIYTQLEACQKHCISSIFCDKADIGKTHTAKCYVKENKYAVYIDCSQVKSKQKLVRQLAKEFGVGNAGKYSDVYADLVFYLLSIPDPIIVILDEAGDLDYPAFLECKALWNATEGNCAWYMMGAEALEQKITRGKDSKKVGFAEIFRRLGSKYQHVSPAGKEAFDEFTRNQVVMVARANKKDVNISEMIGKVNGSLTRVKIEIKKQR